MSESSPQGAERDFYRDTWVRYLGESGGRGARGTRTLPHPVAGEAGVTVCQFVRQFWVLEKVGGFLLVLILPRPETGLREG